MGLKFELLMHLIICFLNREMLHCISIHISNRYKNLKVMFKQFSTTVNHNAFHSTTSRICFTELFNFQQLSMHPAKIFKNIVYKLSIIDYPPLPSVFNINSSYNLAYQLLIAVTTSFHSTLLS